MRGHHHHHQHSPLDDEIAQLESQLEAPVRLQEGWATCIVVENLPKVGPEKQDKLIKVVTKIFSQVGALAEHGLMMPVDEQTKQSLGFAFIAFETPEQAKAAIERTNGYKLDKSHIFAVHAYDATARYRQTPDTYAPPPVKPYQERENLRSWLLDERGFSQYVVRQQQETEIYWNDTNPNAKAEECKILGRTKMTDGGVAWSPRGSYLTTFHQQGIILAGGASFQKLMRFGHPGVKFVDFSPDERFVATFSPQFIDHDNEKDPQAIIVWDVRTGKRMRGFKGPAAGQQWPVFQWSHDGAYFARLGKDQISVYQAPSMQLLDKKSIKVPGVMEFSWSPRDLTIACWVPESGNQAARIMLIEIPTRKEKRQQNMFNVSDCKMYWQSEGDYLCVRVECHTKTKKRTCTNFEVFRVREKNIPVEVLKITDPVTTFAWEPKGARFGVAAGENLSRPDVTFYEVKDKKINMLCKVEKKPVSQLLWSPQGKFCLIAGIKSFNGTLEFFNVETRESMNIIETMATDVEWDPSGRFLASMVTQLRSTVENSYNIWTFQGTQVHQRAREKLWQFAWRPRPPSLLPPAKLTEIKKNLRQWSERYNEMDREAKTHQKRHLIEKREQLAAEFRQFLAERAAAWHNARDARNRLLGFDELQEDDDCDFVEEEVEVVVEEKTEPLK